MRLGAGASLVHHRVQRESERAFHIGMLDVGLIEQRMALKLRVQNPNRFDIPINGISYELEFNDTPFAQGVAQPQTTVPAYGEAMIQTEATCNLGSILRQLEVLQKDKRLRYRLQGKVDLGGWRGSQPFSVDGEIAMPQFAP